MHKLIIKSLSLLALFALGLACTYFYLIQSGFGFFNLIVPGDNSSLESYGFDEFMKGNKATGHFNSKHNNLGIVAVRFTNKNRDSMDVVVFRIKDAGSNTWLYEAKYNTDQFLPGKLFPFGFPQISSSKGKNFTYEIESTNGATGSGIFLDYQKPVFVSVYFFDKSAVVGSFQKMVSFVGQKLINIITNKDDLIQTTVYFLPFLFLLILTLIVDIKKITPYILFILGIIFDVFIVSKNSTFLLVFLVGVWLLAKQKYKTSSIFTLINLAFLTLISFMATIVKSYAYGEKAFVWIFLLLVYICYEKSLEVPKDIIFKEEFSLFINNFLEMAKSNKTRYRVLIPLLSIFSITFGFYLFILSINLVHSGIKIYTRYFSGVIPSVIFSQFIAIILLIFAAFFLFLFVILKTTKTKPLLILLLCIFLHQSTKLSVNKQTAFQYQPKLFTISPQKTSEAWVDVTVNGLNFEDKPFVGKLFLSGEEQVENIINWSNKSIIFRTNPSKTKSGNVCVQTLSRGESNCLPFEYNFSKK